MKLKPFEIIVEFTPQSTKTGITYEMHQVGSLIRCEDCMYSKPIDSEWLECQHDKRVMKVTGFCSWAEPKEKP